MKLWEIFCFKSFTCNVKYSKLVLYHSHFHSLSWINWPLLLSCEHKFYEIFKIIVKGISTVLYLLTSKTLTDSRVHHRYISQIFIKSHGPYFQDIRTFQMSPSLWYKVMWWIMDSDIKQRRNEASLLRKSELVYQWNINGRVPVKDKK